MHEKIIITVGIIIIFLHLSYLGYKKEFTLSDAYKKYEKIETTESSPLSRRWMDFALNSNKKLNLPPATAARFYAYVAATYSDTLSETSDPAQASFATKEIINILYPARKVETENFYKSLGFETTLSPKAKEVFDKYKKRSEEDGGSLTWDKKIPDGSDKWFARDGKFDGGATAGNWKPWILDQDTKFVIPPPPKDGSQADKFETGKVAWAVSERTQKDMDAIYLWHGARGFTKGQAGDNITPAGVWQNILFAESGVQDDKTYAKTQKILAESIADSFIIAWRVKYEYFTKRPSMKIQALDTAVGDPPFPSYVSGHSTISYTAETVLSALLPDKEKVWKQNAGDARNSRLLAGIHYNLDNITGCLLGQKVGEEILYKLGEKSKPKNLTVPNIYGIIGAPFERVIFASARLWAKLLSNSKIAFSELRKPNPGITFTDVSERSGLAKFEGHYPPTNPMTGGAAWGDYDNDEDEDLYLASINPDQENKLYNNKGNGEFNDVSKEAGVNYKGNSWGVSWADFNNDGYLDLFVGNFGKVENLDSTGEADILYKNNGDGSFTDVTKIAGVGGAGHTTGSAWADYNKDGFVDLYVANYGVMLPDGSIKSELNSLYRNNGNGTFTDVARNLGVGDADYGKNWHLGSSPNESIRSGMSYQPVWLDYDGNGYDDIFVATDFGSSPLFKNNGNGTFTDVTKTAGINTYGTNMGAAVGDYDGDLDLDIFVTNIDGDYLWKNNGDGTFSEVANDVGVSGLGHGWGVNFSDFDNDGDPDLHILNGAEGPNWKNEGRRIPFSKDAFYLNKKGKFTDLTRKTHLSETAQTFGGSLADIDKNGFVDIVTQNSDGIINLYKNSGNKNNWISLGLKGKESNTFAIGAKIFVTSNGQTQLKYIQSGGSYLSQNSLITTFGIGDSGSIEKVKIIWPSGKVQDIKDPEVNTILRINE